MTTGTQVSRRTRHKQTTLGGISEIEKETRQKLLVLAGTCNLSFEAVSGCFLGFTGPQSSLLGKSWANEILCLRKIPPRVDGNKCIDPYVGIGQRVRDCGAKGDVSIKSFSLGLRELCRSRDGKSVRASGDRRHQGSRPSRHTGLRRIRTHRDYGSMHRACTHLSQMASQC